MKTISSSAFQGSGLSGTITIPDSVTYIGISAFSGNSLSDSSAFIYKRTASGIDYSTLIGYGGSKKTDVIIPQTSNGVTLKTIDTKAFSETGIKSITIPEGVTAINSSAFMACYITEITIPSTMTKIEANAFRKEVSWGNFNMLNKIINKSGKSFDWKSITGSNKSSSTFVTGNVEHQYGSISVVSD